MSWPLLQMLTAGEPAGDEACARDWRYDEGAGYGGGAGEWGAPTSFYASAFAARLWPDPVTGGGLRDQACDAARRAYLREADQTFDPRIWGAQLASEADRAAADQPLTPGGRVVPAGQQAEGTVLRRG